MGLWRDPCGAIPQYLDGAVGEVRPDKKGVADHANVGAIANNGEFAILFGVVGGRKVVSKPNRAKGVFLENVCDFAHENVLKFLRLLPSPSTLYAVFNWELLTFQGLGEVGVLVVGVHRQENLVPFIVFDEFDDVGQFLDCLFVAQCACDEVVLDINHYQYVLLCHNGNSSIVSLFGCFAITIPWWLFTINYTKSAEKSKGGWKQKATPFRMWLLHLLSHSIME